MPLERTNEAWLRDLAAEGPVQAEALEDLRKVIQAGLPYGLAKYLRSDDPRFDSLVNEVTQDTILRVLERLDTFEGRSKFTTWVYTIAVRNALTELRKARWRETSLDEILEHNPNYLTGESDGIQLQAKNPEDAAVQQDLMERIDRIIREELTERQRTALLALGVKGAPMEVVAEQLNTNRNALYKLLHDARIRLKKRLEAEGLSAQEILAVFD
jgi:RNA polymerase sigma-70 factor, ECF subfamily